MTRLRSVTKNRTQSHSLRASLKLLQHELDNTQWSHDQVCRYAEVVATGKPADRPSHRPSDGADLYLIGNAKPALDLTWSYAQRFCCEQLFPDQKSGVSQLEEIGLRGPHLLDRLLLLIANDEVGGNLHTHALSLAGLRAADGSALEAEVRLLHIGLDALPMVVADATAGLMAWPPIPLQELEPCIPSHRGRKKPRPGFRGLRCW